MDQPNSSSQQRLVDRFSRQVTYLRVSVTDRCDFRCTYCMSEQMQFMPSRDLLTLEEIEAIISAFARQHPQLGRSRRFLRISLPQEADCNRWKLVWFAARADAAGNQKGMAIQHRSTEEVFNNHVRLRLAGRLDEDLKRNYSEDVVLLTVNSNTRGHDAIRRSASRLEEQLPQANFEIIEKQTSGPYALLVWSATSSAMDAVEGADSFVIEDGKIVFQSIHYGLRREAGRLASGATQDGRPADQ